MQVRIDHSLADAGADDPRLMTRALGVLLFCGGVVVAIGVALAAPEGANVTGIYAAAAVGILAGSAALAWGGHARPWTAHALFAAGSGLICLCSYFGGAATGLYAVLLVWLAIVAATFFSTRAVAAHIAWILVASGMTLALAAAPPGPSPLARWLVGSVVVTIAAAVMGWIAAGRRETEARLRAEIAERERLQRELKHLAEHDPLTGVANRRRLESDLTRELARARRDGTPLSLLTLDLDDLKARNDAHGHAAGDRLLKHVASTWTAALRPTDLLARVGGDEFAVLLPDCTLEIAERVKERLCRDVAALSRCSAGAACWDRAETGAELQARADRAMYAEKWRSRRPRRGRA